MDIKKRLQNLVVEIDALKIGSDSSTEYNTGVTKARDLVIGEISKVDCHVCRAKENLEVNKEMAEYNQETLEMVKELEAEVIG